MSKLKSRVVAAAVTGGLLLTWAAPASAHVEIIETEQLAGSFGVLTFAVGHGCGDSPTTKLEIQIPESIVNVTPARNAFYDISVETEKLAEPIASDHGDPITTRDSVVVFTAKEPLPHDQRDTVQLSLAIPDDAAGTKLYFPVVQTCEVGATNWIGMPAAGSDVEPDQPAPFITVVAGSASADDHHGAGVTGDGGGSTSGNDDEDSNGLAIVALIVGALGLAFGVGGFITATRKK